MAERDLTLPLPDHIGRWQRFLAYCQNSAAQAQPLWPSGRLTRINGLVMEATGLKLPLGSTCRIVPSGGAPVEAEVVGFANEKLYLMPSDDVFGLAPGAKVEACDPPAPAVHRFPGA
jgi:flagellum-specific ATP synthase